MPEKRCMSSPICAYKGEGVGDSSKSSARELYGGSSGRVGCESCLRRDVLNAVF